MMLMPMVTRTFHKFAFRPRSVAADRFSMDFRDGRDTL